MKNATVAALVIAVASCSFVTANAATIRSSDQASVTSTNPMDAQAKMSKKMMMMKKKKMMMMKKKKMM